MDEKQIRQQVCTRIPTDEGEFQLCLYLDQRDDKEHLAIIIGDVENADNVLVRVHSECFTGDVLGSRRCDCGEQLQRSMQITAEAGQGIIIYLRQEGRGIGLTEKLRAYNLQDQGLDTVDANLALGHEADERDYTAAAQILADLGVHSVRLLTNNPDKVAQLTCLGVEVTERVPIEPTINADNAGYLQTKIMRMNHLLTLSPFPLTKTERQNGNGAHGLPPGLAG